MKLPYYRKYVMSEDTEIYLIEDLKTVLAMMQEERDFADTHAQRNAYRNVVRMRLERVIEAIRMSDHPGAVKPDANDIPL